MRAFEVSLNNEKLCLAGLDGDGVLTATTGWMLKDGDMFLDVSGLITENARHVRWVRHQQLREGDIIQIKIVQSEAVDPPV